MGNSQGTEATSKKRKLAGNEDASRAAKRPKTQIKFVKDKSGPVRRGRPPKAKPAISAGIHSQTSGLNQSKNALDDELSLLLSSGAGPINAVDGIKESAQAQDKSKKVAIQPEAGKAVQDGSKAPRRKQSTKTKLLKTTFTVKQDSVESKAAFEKPETLASPMPTRRRKKRRSIGQNTRKTKRLFTAAERKGPLHLRTIESKDPWNILEAPSKSLKLDETSDRKKEDLSPNSIREPGKLDAELPGSIKKANSKPRRKRKPIAQIPGSRRVPKKDANVKASVPLLSPKEKVQDETAEASNATTIQPRNQPRKPLADVTNLTPGPKPKKVDLRQPDEETPTLIRLKDKGHITVEPKQNIVYKDPLADTLPAVPIHTIKASRPTESQSHPDLKSTSKEAAASATAGSAREQAPIKVRKLKPAKSALNSTKPPSPYPGPAISPPIKIEPTLNQASLAIEDEHGLPRPPVKQRGRPRQNPDSDALPMTRAKTQPKKVKAHTRPHKQPANTIPVTIDRPIPSQDPGSDSDDPLSLSAPYPPMKAPKRN